jgi:hypothetical protein
VHGARPQEVSRSQQPPEASCGAMDADEVRLLGRESGIPRKAGVRFLPLEPRPCGSRCDGNTAQSSSAVQLFDCEIGDQDGTSGVEGEQDSRRWRSKFAWFIINSSSLMSTEKERRWFSISRRSSCASHASEANRPFSGMASLSGKSSSQSRNGGGEGELS